MRPVSKKRAKAKPAERAARDAVFARDGGCVIAHLHDCHGPLTPHHLRKQGQCGGWSLDNLVALCASGNVAVEDNPELSRWLGLSVAKGVDAVDAAEARANYRIAPNWRPALIDGTAA